MGSPQQVPLVSRPERRAWAGGKVGARFRLRAGLAALLGVAGLAGCQPSGPDQESGPPQAAPAMMHGPEHSDHNPRHGGLFFMALDYEHHLEGTLNPPSLLTIFLYDARTQPLATEKVAETTGLVHRGEFPDPPGIPLRLSEDGHTLVAELDGDLEFPVTLTVLLDLPDGSAGNPELFTFVFDDYSAEPARTP